MYEYHVSSTVKVEIKRAKGAGEGQKLQGFCPSPAPLLHSTFTVQTDNR